jgi:hypothetical protein
VDEISKDFLLEITTINATVFTIVVKETNDDNNNVLNNNKNKNFQFLLDGTPQNDFVSKKKEFFYVFLVSSEAINRKSDIFFTLDSYSGDADLFVNPQNKGFFLKKKNYNYNYYSFFLNKVIYIYSIYIFCGLIFFICQRCLFVIVISKN